MNALIDSGATPWTSATDKLLRRGLLDRMRGMRHGRLIITDPLGRTAVGDPDGDLPDVHVTVHDAGFYRAVAANGSVGAGEAYMNGLWHCDDLVALIRLMVRNRDSLDSLETGLARLGGMAMKLWHAARRNTREGSVRNIAAHYDLGNDFFALFLSGDLMYSSALWDGPDDSLDAASFRKLERVCHLLDLRPGDRVVEIGTGWGGFALHAAARYGCHVTTTTISQEQHALAVKRVADAGLSDRATLLRKDFRDMEGRFDKLVSIEMIEAIGAKNMDAYFAKLGALLRPGGRAVLQAITIEDHRYGQALRAVDYIKRHVFPGSFIPSIAAMLQAKTRVTNLALVHLEDFGDSYARTLQAWRSRFLARMDEARDQGFDEAFLRSWEFYLAYCEGGFRERSIGVCHMVFEKPGRPC